MADTFYGQIKIYGEFDKDKIEGLLLAINEDDPDMSARDDYEKRKSFAEYILEDVENKGCIVIEDNNARLGEFEAIESFCANNKVPYVRHSDSFAEYNGARTVFNSKGQGEFQTCYLDTHDDSIITVKDVREIISNAQSNDEAIEKINTHLQENDPQMPVEKQKIVLSEDALEFLQDSARLGQSPQSEGMRF